MTANSSDTDGIESIEHKGMLVYECSIPGETRKDDVFPAHPNGIQVSKYRWLLIYATRSFRGNDDDKSIIYQLRENAPDGRLIKEGMLAQSITNWEVPGYESNLPIKREHRTPIAYGVPKGARIKGKPAPNANVFVIKWSTVGRTFDPEKNYVEGTSPDPELVRRTKYPEWVQVKLNDAEDDLEFLQEAEEMRQKGYQTGAAICDREDGGQACVCKKQAMPYNSDCTAWVDCIGFGGNRFAAMKNVFNPESGLYEWVETGPYLFDSEEKRVNETHIARSGSGWVTASRTDYCVNHVWYGRGIAWKYMEDPFAEPGPTVYPVEPGVRSPVSLYNGPDGVVRYFAGEGSVTPYKNERDPLYCWNIDPSNGFACSHRRIIYDTVEAGLPIRREAMPKVDMCKLLPHSGGNVQYLLHRVSVSSMFHEHIHGKPLPWVFPPVNEDEKNCSGIYYAKITYKESYPAPWDL